MNSTENTEQAIVSNHQQLQTRSNIPNNNWQQETKPKNFIEFHIKDLKARPPGMQPRLLPPPLLPPPPPPQQQQQQQQEEEEEEAKSPEANASQKPASLSAE